MSIQKNISYRTVISAPLPRKYVIEDENGVQEEIESIETYYLPIDYISSKSVKTGSVVISQPMQSGDTMSDHMYREPTTISLSGSFALNGRNWNNSTFMEIVNTTDRLTSIETVFEYIKNNGILCTITTIESVIDSPDLFSIKYSRNETGGISSEAITNLNASNTRFLTRDSMALTSITWTEMLNSLDFSFEFKEIITVDLIEYKVDLTDTDNPSITSPSAKSIGTLLADSGALATSIIRALWDNGYMESEFLKTLTQIGTISVVIIAAATTVAIAVGLTVVTAALTASLTAAMTGAATATATIVPVGTIIAVAAVAIVAIVGGIWASINWRKNQDKKKKAFKLINGSAEEDGQRLENLLDDIEIEVNSANSKLTIYTISSDEEQTIILPVGGEYYTIKFTSISSEPYWNAEVRNMDDLDTESSSVKIRHAWSVCESMEDMNENRNLWFKDTSKTYQVYLVNPSLGLQENKNNSEAMKNVKKKLSTYSIWVSKGSVSDNVKEIGKAIDNAITSRGFD